MTELIFSFVLLLGQLSSVCNELLPRTNSSNLCSRIPTQSCVHQFNNPRGVDWNSQTCDVEVANNTHLLRCNNESWDYDQVCQSNDGCGVHLEVYRHMPSESLPLYRTAFNLTLSNIFSGKINIRFRETRVGNFSFCVNFTTSLNTAQAFESLWYDCVFHSRLFEGHPFQLEYINANRYGLYLFEVPTGSYHIDVISQELLNNSFFHMQKRTSGMAKAFCMSTCIIAHILLLPSRKRLGSS